MQQTASRVCSGHGWTHCPLVRRTSRLVRGQLNAPYSLAVDTRGCVFVADRNNNRVQVLSPTLTRLGDVTTPGHQLSKPFALHLDELNGRLYVGCDPSNVLVVSVKPT